MHIYPYKAGLKSVKELCNNVPVKRIKLRGSKFKGAEGKTVINWGSSKLPDEVRKCHVFNTPEAVQVAVNKVTAFAAMKDQGVSTVPWTTNKDTAAEWIQERSLVVCRLKTKGAGGDGIVLSETVQELVDAPLYTRYVKKESEWRVHLFNGNVIDLQRKVRDNRVPDDEVNWKIRNHDQGFIFQRHNLNPPVEVIEQASRAIGSCGLDFGAVDIIFNRKQGKAYVLEINCAPGLTGETVQTYSEAIRGLV